MGWGGWLWGAGTSADFAETLPTYALEGSKHVYEVSENAPSLLGSNHIFFRLKISFQNRSHTLLPELLVMWLASSESL